MTGYVAFKIQDALLLNMREFDQIRRDALEDWLEGYYCAIKMGICWTLLIDNKLAAIAGCVPLRKGVIEIFTSTDAMVEQHPRQLLEQGIYFINEMIEIYKPHRVQSVVHIDDERSLRWNKALGLETESLMKGFAEDGADYYMCVKGVA